MPLLPVTPTSKSDACLRAFKSSAPELEVRVCPECENAVEIGFIVALGGSHA
jgi:hypothetical protein